MKRMLIIPGLPRCATTSFVQLLGQHPDIFLPKIKEPHYFLPEKEKYFMFNRKGDKIPFQKSGFTNTEKEFNSNYDNFSKDVVYIDASTLYAVHNQSIDEIAKNKDIDPYFIILKREPFTRSLSHYLYSVSRGEEFRDFETSLKDEAEGKYEDWLLGGYLAGSSPAACVEKITEYWGKDRLIVADMAAADFFSEAFVNKVLAMLQLKQHNFDYNVHSNALTIPSNKILNELRIFFKRVRQINPIILDNKVTRFFFNQFMGAMAGKGIESQKYEHLKPLYYNLYNEVIAQKLLTNR